MISFFLWYESICSEQNKARPRIIVSSRSWKVLEKLMLFTSAVTVDIYMKASPAAI